MPIKGREAYFVDVKKIGGPNELTQNVSHAYLDEAVFRDFIDQIKSELLKKRIVNILERYKILCSKTKEPALQAYNAHNVSQPATLYDPSIMPTACQSDPAPTSLVKQTTHPASTLITHHAFDSPKVPMGNKTTYDQAKADLSGAPPHPAVGVAETFASYNMVNEFVDYLNTLSNTTAANENALAESQLNSRFFPRVQVKHPLEDYIYNQLMNGCGKVVLTGNAGDGKTTLAFAVLQKLGFAGTPSWRIELPEKKLTVIKDMSELPADERGKVMREIWQNEHWRYLLVSNTGTLLEAMQWLKNSQPGIWEELLSAMRAGEPGLLGERLLLINVGNINNIEPALQVLQRMIEEENWQKCSRCALAQDCPIYFNVQLLQQGWKTVRQRLWLLYRHMYEYGCRLTMRQMTAHLAYALTGGCNCRQVAKMTVGSGQNKLWRALFYNRFFGDDGWQEDGAASQLYAVRQVRQAGYGQVLQPAVEQRLWLTEEGRWSDYALAESLCKELKSNKQGEKVAYRRQLRRLLYFWGTCFSEVGEQEKADKNFICDFLDSPALFDYLHMLENTSDHLMVDYKKKIVHVLQEYFAGLPLLEKRDRERLYIPLSRADQAAVVQFLLARFRLADFEVESREGFRADHFLNRKALYLCLKRNKNLDLELSLPFLDYVARRYRGEMTADLHAFYANRLKRFKSQLISYYQEQQAEEDDELEVGELLYLLAGKTRRVRLEFAAGELEVSL